MERKQKKDEQKAAKGMSTVQLAAMIGNQKILQMMDPDWVLTSEDSRREEENNRLREEQIAVRNLYGGFIPSIRDAFRARTEPLGCAFPECLRKKEEGTTAFKPGDSRWGYSIDHVESVVHHFDHGGEDMTYDERHSWYNDESNWQAMHIACNARKGGR